MTTRSPDAPTGASDRRRQRQALFDPDTVSGLERLGVAPGWRCLEVGVGEGSIAAWLTARAGAVVVTDVDAGYLRAVQARLGEAVTVLHHDLEGGPLPIGGFDLVHLRFVLEHVAAKEAALAGLVAALRPGGRLMVEYTDFAACAAAGGAYAAAMAAFAAALPCVGTDDDWAVRLPSELQRLGLTVIGASSHQRYFQGGSTEAAYWSALWIDKRDRIRSAAPGGRTIEQGMAAVADRRCWLPGPAVVTVVGRRAG